MVRGLQHAAAPPASQNLDLATAGFENHKILNTAKKAKEHP
jgi:hypothetical protein